MKTPRVSAVGAECRSVSESDTVQIFDCIKAFAGYGFCKFHALAFAHLAYESAWLKYYYPAAYAASLINNQPLGFYPARTIVQNARRHGIKFLGVDVNRSDVRCTIATVGKNEGIRLSLTCVKGISLAIARSIVSAGRSIRCEISFYGHNSVLLISKT